MCQKRLLTIIFSLGLALAVLPTHGPAHYFERAAKPAPGQAQAAVRNTLGEPPSKSAQIIHRRYIEQWQYDKPAPLYVDFDCIPGEQARVVNVHDLNLPN